MYGVVVGIVDSTTPKVDVRGSSNRDTTVTTDLSWELPVPVSKPERVPSLLAARTVRLKRHRSPAPLKREKSRICTHLAVPLRADMGVIRAFV
jgi:hypothetical protein